MNLKDKIHTIREKQVMLDRDLAELYGVETGNLNKAVKRNKERFPEDFMFQLNQKEFNNLKFHFGTSSWGGTRKLPNAFTEHGITALSGVLKSKKSTEVNIRIIREFIAMKKLLLRNRDFFNKFQQIDQKLLEHDKNFEKVFNAMQDKLPEKGIFYDGEVYDAYKFICNLVKKANKSIILIDNYINTSVITLFSEKKKNVNVTIYTKEISDKIKLAEEKFNKQYKNLNIKQFNKSHDRFLIIDNTTYHIGASLKDLGKKWTAFSKLKLNILSKLEL